MKKLAITMSGHQKSFSLKTFHKKVIVILIIHLLNYCFQVDSTIMYKQASTKFNASRGYKVLRPKNKTARVVSRPVKCDTGSNSRLLLTQGVPVCSSPSYTIPMSMSKATRVNQNVSRVLQSSPTDSYNRPLTQSNMSYTQIMNDLCEQVKSDNRKGQFLQAKPIGYVIQAHLKTDSLQKLKILVPYDLGNVGIKSASSVGSKRYCPIGSSGRDCSLTKAEEIDHMGKKPLQNLKDACSNIDTNPSEYVRQLKSGSVSHEISCGSHGYTSKSMDNSSDNTTSASGSLWISKQLSKDAMNNNFQQRPVRGSVNSNSGVGSEKLIKNVIYCNIINKKDVKESVGASSLSSGQCINEKEADGESIPIVGGITERVGIRSNTPNCKPCVTQSHMTSKQINTVQLNTKESSMECSKVHKDHISHLNGDEMVDQVLNDSYGNTKTQHLHPGNTVYKSKRSSAISQMKNYGTKASDEKEGTRSQYLFYSNQSSEGETLGGVASEGDPCEMKASDNKHQELPENKVNSSEAVAYAENTVDTYSQSVLNNLKANDDSNSNHGDNDTDTLATSMVIGRSESLITRDSVEHVSANHLGDENTSTDTVCNEKGETIECVDRQIENHVDEGKHLEENYPSGISVGSKERTVSVTVQECKESGGGELGSSTVDSFKKERVKTEVSGNTGYLTFGPSDRENDFVNCQLDDKEKEVETLKESHGKPTDLNLLKECLPPMEMSPCHVIHVPEQEKVEVTEEQDPQHTGTVFTTLRDVSHSVDEGVLVYGEKDVYNLSSTECIYTQKEASNTRKYREINLCENCELDGKLLNMLNEVLQWDNMGSFGFSEVLTVAKETKSEDTSHNKTSRLKNLFKAVVFGSLRMFQNLIVTFCSLVDLVVE